MYTYRAKVLRVIDGDTIHAEVDLGFDHYSHFTLRLMGINCPEMSTEEGKEAKAALEGFLALDEDDVLTIETIKDRREKYGRYLAWIYLPDGTNINRRMMDGGYATPYAP